MSENPEKTRTDEEFEKAVAASTLELADTIKAQNEKLAELQKGLVELKRPALFEEDADGNLDNGAAGGDGNRSIIRILRGGTSAQRQTGFVCERIGDGDKELFEKLYHAAQTGDNVNLGRSAFPVTRALSVGDNDAGGFTVGPGDFMAGVLQMAVVDQPILNSCQKVQIGTDSLSAAMLSQTFGSSPSYFGGVTHTWEAEAASMSENTNPSFQLRAMRGKQVRTLHKVSNRLVRMNPGFASFLGELLGRAHGYEIESKIHSGNGISQPQGIRDDTNVTAVTRDTSSHFYTADAKAMIAAVDQNFAGGTFYLRLPTMLDLYDTPTTKQPKTTISVENYDAPLVRPSLFGRPVVYTQHCAALATAADVVYLDPSAYLIAIGEDSEMSTSSEAYWTSNQLGIKLISYLDGQLVWPDACKILAA